MTDHNGAALPEDPAVTRRRAREIALKRLAVALGVVTLISILAVQAFYAVKDHDRQIADAAQAAQIEELVRNVEDQAKVNYSVSQQVKKVLLGVRSCTTPRGDCAKAGAQAQLELTGAVNEVTIVAAICTATILSSPTELTDQQIEEKIRDCVVTQTARGGKS